MRTIYTPECPEMKKPYLTEIEHDDMILQITRGIFQAEVTAFVTKVYYERDDYQFKEPFEDVLIKMLAEDEFYTEHSTIYSLLTPDRDIIATCRTIERPSNSSLPIEHEFELDLREYTARYDQVNRIYEVARLATRAKGTKCLLILLQELIRNAHSFDFVVASLDSRVLKGLRKIGFGWFDLSESKHYLGSETCPVAMRPIENLGGIFTDLADKMKAPHQKVNLIS